MSSTDTSVEPQSTQGLTSEQVLQLILPANVRTGHGGYLIDSDSNQYLDMVSAWGANLLGYGYPRIAAAVAKQAQSHFNLGVAGPEYGRLEKLIATHVPSAEVFYPLKNGSDATAAAIRLARHCTGRTRILHWGYHGAQDWYMAGIGVPGVPQKLREDIQSLERLDPEQVRRAFAAEPGAIACLILDPFHPPMANAAAMAEIATIVRDAGALLVFDEVLSGLRAAPGGMQHVWGVVPDLTCLGKGIANGLALSLLVGREAFMRHIYTINYSLTFRLEALPLVAAFETISEVVERDVATDLARKGRRLKASYASMARARGLQSTMTGHDSRPQLAFHDEGPLMAGTSNYLVVRELAARRICTYGTFNLCFAHTDADVDRTLEALAAGLDRVVELTNGAGVAPISPATVPAPALAPAADAPVPATPLCPPSSPSRAVALARKVARKGLQFARRHVSRPTASQLSPPTVVARPTEPAIPAQVDPLSVGELLALSPGGVEARIRGVPRAELASRFGHDPWFFNYVLSIWERTNGVIRLETRPWMLTLSILSTCNADCQFCNVPLRRTRNPALELDLDVTPHLKEILRYNKVLIITGGEPTIHPRFGKLLDGLKDVIDPRAHIAMITHGHRLHKFRAQLEALPVHLQISINAGTAKTHHKLMRLGEDAFDRIIESARWARSLGRTVELSVVILRDNLGEVPAILELAEDLGAHAVYLRTLIPGQQYAARFESTEAFGAELAPWTHPDFERLREEARAAIARAKMIIYTDTDQWGLQLQGAEATEDVRKAIRTLAREVPPLVRTCGSKRADQSPDAWRQDSGNPYKRQAPFRCDAPWHVNKVLEQNLRVDVCGFLQHVKGYENIGLHGSDNYEEIWNSPALMHVRESLLNGPLLPECELCPYQMTGEWMSNVQTPADSDA